MYLMEQIKFYNMLNNILKEEKPKTTEEYQDILKRFKEEAQKGKEVARKVILLDKFYKTMRRDKAKVVINFDNQKVITSLLNKGLVSEDYVIESHQVDPFKKGYGFDIVPTDLTTEKFRKLLAYHVDKELNICGYFDKKANSIFCFNLDKKKTKIRQGYPMDKLQKAVDIAFDLVIQALEKIGIPCLACNSGQGYHIWVRIEEAIDNNDIYYFMDIIWNWAMLSIPKDMWDLISILKYPLFPELPQNKNNIENHSLRLFGSNHARTGEFTKIHDYENNRIYSINGVAQEKECWDYFEHFLNYKTITKDKFYKTLSEIKELCPEGSLDKYIRGV